MRTKTLLVAVAALALSLATSQAQVYSQNVVGYVNVTIPAGKFALVGGTLDTALGSNTVNNVLTTGLLSASAGSGQSTLLLWNGNSFSPFLYYNAADASPFPAGWYDTSGNPCTNNFDPANGAFLQNPSGGSITVTMIGQVLEGNHTYTVKPGFGFYGVTDPFNQLALDDTRINFPATSSQDTYQLWTGNNFGSPLIYYNAADASPFPAGWYDTSGTLQSTNPVFWPGPGQGYLVQHFGGTSNWVVSYTVPRP